MRNISTTSVNSTLNRSIFFFYEKALRYVPILLMLCHWYGAYRSSISSAPTLYASTTARGS